MPCWTISTVKVDFGKIASPELLEQTLDSLGLNPQRNGNKIHFGRGEWINVQSGESLLQQGRDVAELKRAHSKTIVQTQAKRFGWQVKEVAENKFEIVRAQRL